MRTACVVQARMGSSRLPGKAMRPLAGKPLILHVLERARALPVDAVILATSTLPSNDLLAETAVRAGIQVVREHELDVLGRFRTAATLVGADVIVRVTGDCPLLASDVGARVIAHFLRFRAEAFIDYCSNDTTCSGFPDGTDIEVFTMEALLLADRCAMAAQDREHVTRWIRRRLVCATVVSAEDFSPLKLSCDTEADFAVIARIMGYLPPGQFELADTIRAARLAGIFLG